MNTAFLEITNGVAVARERIPNLAFDTFRKEALTIVKTGGKVVHFFAYRDGDVVKLMAILRKNVLRRTHPIPIIKQSFATKMTLPYASSAHKQRNSI